MKRTELVRVNAERPDNTIEVMLQYLNEIQNIELEKTERNDIEELVKQIVDFQDEDGSFKLVDSYEIESDCRVAYCFFPTYLSTAFLMKAFLFDKNLLIGNEEVLAKAMKASMARRLKGQGYDDTKGQINALKVFINAGVKQFIREYGSFCPEFCEMVIGIAKKYKVLLDEERFYGPWGENYEESFRTIADALLDDEEYSYIFVYGTLLMGQTNYYRFLSPMRPVMRAEIEGYTMFDLGSFPGIVKGEGRVKGEIYKVDSKKLSEIDRLEGEGSLYKRVIVQPKAYDSFENDEIEVYTYVYNDDVKDCKEIPYEAQPYKSEYVWYIAYGSNMLSERFERYICGGYCEMNGKEYEPCDDDELLYESVMVEMPYNMYFANYNMGSWENSAVSFLDVNSFGSSYGRAYLIKKNQLEHIHRCEGKSGNWYPDCIEIGEIQGLKAYTFTNKITKKAEPISKVSAAYFTTLLEGLAESGLGISMAYDYLFNCTREDGMVGWRGYFGKNYKMHKNIEVL
ncbi:MAG: gamma-glutamylcyclotransferase [Lachnospiraceae bacterium]|nr:gamma-glutamylcyclotransferase [Lachnospiraceae bacterium]